jgi:hypothetical protein
VYLQTRRDLGGRLRSGKSQHTDCQENATQISRKVCTCRQGDAPGRGREAEISAYENCNGIAMEKFQVCVPADHEMRGVEAEKRRILINKRIVTANIN